MKWDDLQYFLAVARNRTLTAAAAQMGVDATTIGRHIDRLSSALNTGLFETTKSGYMLTASGNDLLSRAEEVERNILNIRSEVAGERTRLAGTVRISLSEGFATWVLAPMLAGFRERHPEINLEIVSTNGFLNPSKREVDLAIMLARPVRGKLIARKLTDYDLGLYAASEYVARNGSPANLPALRAHKLLGYIPDFIYAEELRYLSEIDDGLEPAISSSSINVQHILTRTGCGICALPRFIGAQDPLLVPILEGQVSIRRSFWIVVHDDLRRSARIEAVITWLDALVREQGGILLGR